MSHVSVQVPAGLGGEPQHTLMNPQIIPIQRQQDVPSADALFGLWIAGHATTLTLRTTGFNDTFGKTSFYRRNVV